MTCLVCKRDIPLDESCMVGDLGVACLSHENETIEVHRLTLDGQFCIFRNRQDAEELALGINSEKGE